MKNRAFLVALTVVALAAAAVLGFRLLQRNKPLPPALLGKKIQKIYQEVFTPQQSASLAVLHAQVPLAGPHAAKRRAQQYAQTRDISVSRADKAWDKAEKLRRRNLLLQEKQTQQKNQQMLVAQPLHISHLSFGQNAQGAALQKETQIDCGGLQGLWPLSFAQCRHYDYQDGSYSEILFAQDVLRLRRDHDAQGKLTLESRFSPDFGPFARRALMAVSVHSIPAGGPERRIFYGDYRQPLNVEILDRQTGFTTDYAYYPQAIPLSYSYYEGLDGHIRQGKYAEQIWFKDDGGRHLTGRVNTDAPVLNKGTYTRTLAQNGASQKTQGKWYLNDAGQAVLDSGFVLPSAGSWGAGPSYCHLYPHDCK